MIASEPGYTVRLPDRRCVCGHWCSSHALPGDSDYRKTGLNCGTRVFPAGPCECREFVPDGEAA